MAPLCGSKRGDGAASIRHGDERVDLVRHGSVHRARADEAASVHGLEGHGDAEVEEAVVGLELRERDLRVEEEL